MSLTITSRRAGLSLRIWVIAVTGVIDRAQVFDADRVTDLLLREEPTAAGLGAEVDQPWVGSEHRDAKGERQVTFQRGGVVGNEM